MMWNEVKWHTMRGEKFFKLFLGRITGLGEGVKE